MIIYQSDKRQFIDNVFTNRIDEIISDQYYKKLGRKFGASELTSFRNSLSFMDRVLNDDGIPDDSGICIEYNIPGTSMRVDFIITGTDETELKMWYL